MNSLDTSAEICDINIDKPMHPNREVAELKEVADQQS
jgi:hypothetical protein